MAEVYPNGIDQLELRDSDCTVRSIKGFENAHITRPGYAIEYDYFDPRGSCPMSGDVLLERVIPSIDQHTQLRRGGCARTGCW